MASNTKNEEKKAKRSFFKDVIKSIKDFDKYEDFLIDGLGKNIVYLSKIVAIFTLVITIFSTYKFSQTINSIITYFNDNITEMVYANGVLTVNQNNKLETNLFEDLLGDIIIDTSNLEESQIESYKEALNNKRNGILLLKDQVIIKNEMITSTSTIKYTDLFENEEISLNKDDVMNYFLTNQVNMYITTFIMIYFYMFILYLFSALLDALLLAILGYIIARLIKINIRFDATLKLGIHSLTLPMVLNIIYVIINGLTGFVVQYFQFMYTAISYIYIITTIFMIKTDYIKRRMDLQKIQSQQAQIKMEMEKQKQKEEEEETDRKNEDERKQQEEKERKSDDENGQNPEGSKA